VTPAISAYENGGVFYSPSEAVEDSEGRSLSSSHFSPLIHELFSGHYSWIRGCVS